MPGTIPKTPFSVGLQSYYDVMSKQGLNVADAFARHAKPKPPQTAAASYTEVDVNGGTRTVRRPLGSGYFMAGPEDFNRSNAGNTARFGGRDASWDNLAKALTGVDNPGLVKTAYEYYSSKCNLGDELLGENHPILRILRAQRLLKLMPTHDVEAMRTVLSLAGFTDSIGDVGTDTFAAFVGVSPNNLEYTDQLIIFDLANMELSRTPPVKRPDLPAREAIQKTLDELLTLAPREVTRTRARELLLSRFSRLDLLSPSQQQDFINSALGISIHESGYVSFDPKMLAHVLSDLQRAPAQRKLDLPEVPRRRSTPVATAPTALVIRGPRRGLGDKIWEKIDRFWRWFDSTFLPERRVSPPQEPQARSTAIIIMDLPVASPAPPLQALQAPAAIAPIAPAAGPKNTLLPGEENLYRRMANEYLKSAGLDPIKNKEHVVIARTLEAYLIATRPVSFLLETEMRAEVEEDLRKGKYEALVRTVMEYLEDDASIAAILNPRADEATRLDGWEARGKRPVKK